jgi:phospholipid/cholesterol/gamma-HCH transport system substrate-binding protein
MGLSRRQRLAFLARLAILGLVGVACASYLFVMQRGPVPLRETYEIRAEFTAADAVVSGLGQPVNVAGVKVGSVTGTRLNSAGRPVVTMTITRSELPRVHADARATISPITPLKDMQIELDPGRRSARPLPDGGLIAVARTQAPVDLDDLLAAMDGDTRSFFQSLLSSMQVGTQGRALDMRRLFAALGPTTRQAGAVSRALAGRRRELARLVTNLATVTRAASQDDDLATAVAAGNRTLAAIEREDAPLRKSLDQLPGTLETTRSTLESTARFSARLTPTLAALTPAVRRLPGTFEAVTPFAKTTTKALHEDIRPFIREAQPLVRSLAPAVRDLSSLTQPLATTLRTANYALNELAYNPPGNDEGFLFWTAFFVHNFGSVFSTSDAHGSIGRAEVLVNCQLLSGSAPGGLLRLLTGTSNFCPGD